MDPKVTVLDNGMRVVSDPMPQLETIAIGLWVNAGCRHERREENGIAHMLEHMAFKGTERRDARAIAEDIESVGGYLNAHTGHSQTAYHARLLKQDLELGIELLSDIVLHSTFETKELERERGVILQEIGCALDTPDDVIFDHLQATAYPDQPLGRPILGTAESVAALGRDDLHGFMARNYLGPAMTFAASGAVDHDAVCALCAEYFTGLPRPNGAGRAEPTRYSGGEFRETKPLEQVHLALAFEGPPVTDDDHYLAWSFAEVLGGGMSSRLFQEVREKRGLAYSVFSCARGYEDTGLLTIYAGTGPESAADLIPVILGEIEKVGRDAGEEEVARVRALIKSGILMGMESPANRCEVAASMLHHYGRILSPEEIIARVEAVDAGAVRAYAERLLKQGNPAVAALGPIDGIEPLERIEARLG
ncbi:MAG: M16 family metallopeptidase [Alphaproteobacteria bacterium]